MTKENLVERVKFSNKRRYFRTNFKVNAKIETNITKRNVHDKIHALSEYCCELKNIYYREKSQNFLSEFVQATFKKPSRMKI